MSDDLKAAFEDWWANHLPPWSDAQELAGLAFEAGSDWQRAVAEQDDLRFTAEQAEVLHRIIAEHSTDTVDYELAADDMSAALFGGCGKWADKARLSGRAMQQDDLRGLREALTAILRSVYLHDGHNIAFRTFGQNGSQIPDQVQCRCGAVFSTEGDHARHQDECVVKDACEAALARLTSLQREVAPENWTKVTDPRGFELVRKTLIRLADDIRDEDNVIDDGKLRTLIGFVLRQWNGPALAGRNTDETKEDSLQGTASGAPKAESGVCTDAVSKAPRPVDETTLHELCIAAKWMIDELRENREHPQAALPYRLKTLERLESAWGAAATDETKRGG